MNRSKDLIDLMKSKPILRVGGAFDAMSAKLVELENFDAVWAGSFAISATHALPDASILTMTEFLHAAQNMLKRVTFLLLQIVIQALGDQEMLVIW